MAEKKKAPAKKATGTKKTPAPKKTEKKNPKMPLSYYMTGLDPRGDY